MRIAGSRSRVTVSVTRMGSRKMARTYVIRRPGHVIFRIYTDTTIRTHALLAIGYRDVVLTRVQAAHYIREARTSGSIERE